MKLEKGDIVFVEIPEPDPENPSHTQKNPRPALVFQRQNNPNSPVITLIPFTKIKSAIDYKPSMAVDRSYSNGLNEDSILLILQMGAYDKRQITHKIGRLEDHSLKEANKLVRELLGF